MGLNDNQIRLFRQNGFLRLPGQLPSETVDRLRNTILQDIEEEIEPVSRNKENRVVRLSQLLARDSIFKETATSPLVLDSLESLLGSNIEILTNRHNHATLNPMTNNYTRFHRDVLQWTRNIVTIIVYLEESTVENGCTHVIPGTHLFSWIQNPGTKTQIELDDSLREQEIPLPMPAGGMIVIDGHIFHHVGRNQTQNTRMSMTFGYLSVDELAAVQDPFRVLVRGESAYVGNVERAAE